MLAVEIRMDLEMDYSSVSLYAVTVSTSLWVSA